MKQRIKSTVWIQSRKTNKQTKTPRQSSRKKKKELKKMRRA